jgi:hypothetical protein
MGANEHTVCLLYSVPLFFSRKIFVDRAKVECCLFLTPSLVLLPPHYVWTVHDVHPSLRFTDFSCHHSFTDTPIHQNTKSIGVTFSAIGYNIKWSVRSMSWGWQGSCFEYDKFHVLLCMCERCVYSLPPTSLPPLPKSRYSELNLGMSLSEKSSWSLRSSTLLEVYDPCQHNDVASLLVPEARKGMELFFLSNVSHVI